jgi:hypothetical protein
MAPALAQIPAPDCPPTKKTKKNTVLPNSNRRTRNRVSPSLTLHQRPNPLRHKHSPIPPLPIIRTINALQGPVELPARTDDNSSEEIMMSSTAYPGQEWRPLGFSEWEDQ